MIIRYLIGNPYIVLSIKPCTTLHYTTLNTLNSFDIAKLEGKGETWALI
jgi:hypothetical protein